MATQRKQRRRHKHKSRSSKAASKQEAAAALGYQRDAEGVGQLLTCKEVFESKWVLALQRAHAADTQDLQQGKQ